MVATFEFSQEIGRINWMVINDRRKLLLRLTCYIKYNNILNHKAEPAGFPLQGVVV